MQAIWRSLAGEIDKARHEAVAAKLAIQARDAAEWRDQCNRVL